MFSNDFLFQYKPLCYEAPSAVPFWTFRYRSTKKADHFCDLLFPKTGNVLFSQAVARQVSSALESLTSVFEMGTGGSSPPLSPDILARLFYAILCQLFFPHSLHTPVCASLVSRASSSDLKNPSQFLLFSLFNTNNEKSFTLSHFFDYLLLVKFSID